MNRIKNYLFEEKETEIPEELNNLDIDKINQDEYFTGKKHIENELKNLTEAEKQKIMNERKIINKEFNSNPYPRPKNPDELPGFNTDYSAPYPRPKNPDELPGFNTDYSAHENGGKSTKKHTKKHTKPTKKPIKKRTKPTKKRTKNII